VTVLVIIWISKDIFKCRHKSIIHTEYIISAAESNIYLMKSLFMKVSAITVIDLYVV